MGYAANKRKAIEANNRPAARAVAPSPKEVVKLLCDVQTKAHHCEDHHIHFCKCPNPKCKRKDDLIWKTGSGYGNPHTHLVSCMGGTERLLEFYFSVKEGLESSGTSPSSIDIASAIQNMGATPEEVALHEYACLIVDENATINCVEKKAYRQISRHATKLSRKRMRNLLLSLEKVVEDKISERMKNKKGTILYDGWTRDGTHYVAIYAAYVDDAGDLTIDLLACSPMPAMEEEGEPGEDASSTTAAAATADGNAADADASVDAAEFNAEVHRNYFDRTFEYYGYSAASDFVLAQIADNASVNLKVARDGGWPHLSCQAHALQLGLSDMGKSDALLSDTFAEIRDTVSKVKGSIKESAILRSLTHLKPAVAAPTRWSSNFNVGHTFLALHDSLRQLVERDDSALTFNTGVQFKRTTTKYTKMLGEFNKVSVYLQKQGLPRNIGQRLLDKLNADIQQQKGNPQHVFYRCKFKADHTKAGNKHDTDPDFVKGLIKIQNCRETSMTPREKAACKSLRKPTEAADADYDDSDDEEMAEIGTGAGNGEYDILSALKDEEEAEEEAANTYIDTRPFLSSAAIVEQLWSEADAILVKRRRRMNPIMLECLLFLKANRKYWNQEDICTALKNLVEGEREKRNQDKIDAAEREDIAICMEERNQIIDGIGNMNANSN